MKPRVRVAAIAALVVALLLALAWLLRRSGNDEAIRASGTVEAREADLAFPRPGRIAEVAVEEGDRVEAGATLATLEDAPLQGALGQARAQAAAAAARLAELESGFRPEEIAQGEAALAAATERLETAARELERSRALHAGQAIARRQLEQAEAAHAAAAAEARRAAEQLSILRHGPRREQVAAQRALVDQAEAGVRQAEAGLDDAVIRAPIAGVVTVRHRDPGETVPAGAPVVTVMDLDDRWVRIFVREDAIGRVQLGQRTGIESDSWPDRVFTGEVSFIAQEAEFTPSNVQTREERVKLVYEVKVRIVDDPDRALKPGTPADVRLSPAP
ncbi:MAG TPA: HlyD family efflux transporter periplasmic adaptor subunit [Gemmatimonadota bacterium]|nr:HlyD family efflux transporter periplasmic adaptor subunit [Gemmatimonadota bacterium]